MRIRRHASVASLCLLAAFAMTALSGVGACGNILCALSRSPTCCSSAEAPTGDAVRAPAHACCVGSVVEGLDQPVTVCPSPTHSPVLAWSRTAAVHPASHVEPATSDWAARGPPPAVSTATIVLLI